MKSILSLRGPLYEEVLATQGSQVLRININFHKHFSLLETLVVVELFSSNIV